MREALVAQDALSQEGIFRLAGDQNEMKRIKGDMNRTKTFDAKDADMNTIANLLKVTRCHRRSRECSVCARGPRYHRWRGHALGATTTNRCILGAPD
jgi:hypothetical protein